MQIRAPASSGNGVIGPGVEDVPVLRSLLGVFDRDHRRPFFHRVGATQVLLHLPTPLQEFLGVAHFDGKRGEDKNDDEGGPQRLLPWSSKGPEKDEHRQRAQAGSYMVPVPELHRSAEVGNDEKDGEDQPGILLKHFSQVFPVAKTMKMRPNLASTTEPMRK